MVERREPFVGTNILTNWMSTCREQHEDSDAGGGQVAGFVTAETETNPNWTEIGQENSAALKDKGVNCADN